ncbi:MAG: shikimate dehydrogenase [Campylobacterales bacterium]|nr:shikimate dehydrogenase [Campylobacterales bacterium]
MKNYTIFGNPVAHSKSPCMHNLAFSGLGEEALYTRTLLEDGSKLREVFLANDLSGANITVPHKEEALRACDEVDSFARAVGAVNTIVRKGDKLHGYNTDALGFLKALQKFELDIKSILILGAGGSAKAISVILREAGYEVTILNRSEARLESFKAQGFQTYCFENFTVSPYDLIVNSTSAGLEDDALPAPKEMLIELLCNAKASIDIIYGKTTPFLKLSQNYNLPIKDGSDMLLYQGVLAFEKFVDNRHSFEAIEKYMKRAFI